MKKTERIINASSCLLLCQRSERGQLRRGGGTPPKVWEKNQKGEDPVTSAMETRRWWLTIWLPPGVCRKGERRMQIRSRGKLGSGAALSLGVKQTRAKNEYHRGGEKVLLTVIGGKGGGTERL